MSRNVPPRRILCAVDFTHASAVAASYACQMAEGLGASLILCHALTEAPDILSLEGMFTPGAGWPGSEEATRRWKEDAERRLRLLADTLPLDEVELRVDEGDPAEAILQAAVDVDADAIFVGSHGRRGFRRALVGSVAERLVRWSPVPVTVVRWSEQPDVDEAP